MQSQETSGELGDDQFKLVDGWYDGDSNTFNVQSGGDDTLILFDGQAGAGVTPSGIVASGMSSDNFSIVGNELTYVI